MDLTPALGLSSLTAAVSMVLSLTWAARINPVVFEEVQLAFEEEMPKCDDWTPVNIHSKLLTMVGRITGRIFLGESSIDQSFTIIVTRVTNNPKARNCATTRSISKSFSTLLRYSL